MTTPDTPKPYPDAPTSSRLRERFTMYRTAVMPPNAPPVQVRECKAAFMAGCEAMFDIIVNEPPDNEEEAMVFMASLKNEIIEEAGHIVQEMRKAWEEKHKKG